MEKKKHNKGRMKKFESPNSALTEDTGRNPLD